MIPPLVPKSMFVALQATVAALFRRPGSYGSGAAYVLGDTVTFSGSLFQALQATIGNAPSSASPPVDTAYWQVVVGRGPDNTSTQKITNVALGGHRVVRQTATGPDYADCGVLNHQDNILGLTTGAAAAGALVTIQRSGEVIEPTWNWATGLIFLGHNGLLTQTPLPSPEAAFLQPVGFSMTPQSIFVALRDPFTLKD